MKKGILSILFLGFSTSFFAQSLADAQVLLDSANLKYQTSEFYDAINIYHQVSDNFESPALYRNLGNAYFRSNNIPYAILYYEKALKLDPQNNDVLFNLETANGLTVDRFEIEGDQKFGTFVNNLVKSVSPNDWALYSIIIIVLFFLLLTLTILSKKVSVKRSFFYLAILTAMVSLTLVVFSMKSKSLSIKHSHAIVVAPKADVKSEPNALSTDLFVLHEGSKVELLNESEEWIEIRIPNGTKGWIPLEDLAKI